MRVLPATVWPRPALSAAPGTHRWSPTHTLSREAPKATACFSRPFASTSERLTTTEYIISLRYIFFTYTCTCFNEMRRKEERSKQGQTNKKAKQHSTPKAVTFPKENELPQVGFEPITCTCTVHYITIFINIVRKMA